MPYVRKKMVKFHGKSNMTLLTKLLSLNDPQAYKVPLRKAGLFLTFKDENNKLMKGGEVVIKLQEENRMFTTPKTLAKEEKQWLTTRQLLARGVMNTNGGAKGHRVQLRFSDAGFEEVVDLEKQMGITRQDLFKYALRWLQWTFEEIRDGGKIQVKGSNGEVKEVVAPFLAPPKKSLNA